MFKDLEEFLKNRQRCSRKGCRRVTYKHVGKFGAGCEMPDINEEELKKDDEEKFKLRQAEEEHESNSEPESSSDEEDEDLRRKKEETLERLRQEVKKKKGKGDKGKSSKIDKEIEALRNQLVDLSGGESGHSKSNFENKTSLSQINKETEFRNDNGSNETRRNEKDLRRSRGSNYFSDSNRYNSHRRERYDDDHGRYSSSRDDRRNRDRQERSGGRRDENHQRQDRFGDYNRHSSSRDDRQNRERRERSPSRVPSMTNIDCLATTLNRIVEEGGKLLPAPSWGKVSFKAWKKAVKEWTDNSGNPQKKAQLLIERMLSEEEQKDHPGLREMVVLEIQEDLNFDKRHRDVII